MKFLLFYSPKLWMCVYNPELQKTVHGNYFCLSTPIYIGLSIGIIGVVGSYLLQNNRLEKLLLSVLLLVAGWLSWQLFNFYIQYKFAIIFLFVVLLVMFLELMVITSKEKILFTDNFDDPNGALTKNKNNVVMEIREKINGYLLTFGRKSKQESRY